MLVNSYYNQYYHCCIGLGGMGSDYVVKLPKICKCAPPLPRRPSKYFSDPAPHLPTTNFITPPPPYFFWIRACYCWLGLTCKIFVCYFNYMKLKLFRKLVAHKNRPVGFIAQRQHRNSFHFF